MALAAIAVADIYTCAHARTSWYIVINLLFAEYSRSNTHLMSIITVYLSPVFLHSHLIVKAPIMSSDQLVQPVLPRENGSVLRDSVET